MNINSGQHKTSTISLPGFQEVECTKTGPDEFEVRIPGEPVRVLKRSSHPDIWAQVNLAYYAQVVAKRK